MAGYQRAPSFSGSSYGDCSKKTYDTQGLGAALRAFVALAALRDLSCFEDCRGFLRERRSLLD